METQYKKKIFFVDIDGTLCSTIDGNYKDAQPYFDRINKVNNLYNKGHTIIIITSRGYVTGINWELLTKKQLSNWGVKYHQLLFSKPYFDYFIDDKAINADYFFREKQNLSSDVSGHNSQRSYRRNQEGKQIRGSHYWATD